jgi:rhamnosyltransferase
MPESLALPRIAVLLAVYNGMKFLPIQLQSILAQEGIDVHIWVSIDPSTDISETWLKEQAKQELRITILPTVLRYGRAALNFFRLLREVPFHDADYIALADQDDIWQPNKLLQAHTALSATGADGYSSNVTAFWEDGRHKAVVKSQAQRQWDFLFEAPGPGCTFVMEAAMALDIQRFIQKAPPSLYNVDFHDWFIYAYARSHGYHWHIDTCSHMLYRQHSNNQLGANTSWKSLWARATEVIQGRWMQQAKIIAQLIDWENHPIVTRWFHGQRIGYLLLATQSSQCRRRRRDQWLFACTCLWMACLPHRADISHINHDTSKNQSDSLE